MLWLGLQFILHFSISPIFYNFCGSPYSSPAGYAAALLCPPGRRCSWAAAGWTSPWTRRRRSRTRTRPRSRTSPSRPSEVPAPTPPPGPTVPQGVLRERGGEINENLRNYSQTNLRPRFPQRTQRRRTPACGTPPPASVCPRRPQISRCHSIPQAMVIARFFPHISASRFRRSKCRA